MSLSPQPEPRRQHEGQQPDLASSPPVTQQPSVVQQPPVLAQDPPVSDAALAGVPAPVSVEARSYVAGIVTAGLAAVCGAVFTSWLGAQGTLAGAMIGATIGSSVSEIVRAPLTSLEQRILHAGVSARRIRRDGLLMTVLSSPLAARQLLGMLSRRAVATVAVISVAGFVLAMGGVTAVEVASGEPLAAIVADADFSDTTLGQTLPPPPAFLVADPQRPAAEATAQEGVDADGPRAGASPSPASETGDLAGVAPSQSPEASEDEDGNALPDAAASPAVDGSPVADGSPDVESSPEAAAVSMQAPASGSPAATHTPSVTVGPTTPGATTATLPWTVTPETTAATTTPTSAPPPFSATGSPAGALPANAGTPMITPTRTPSPASATPLTPAPSPPSTPTVTNTPVPGASTPAAPPATLPPPPQT